MSRFLSSEEKIASHQEQLPMVSTAFEANVFWLGTGRWKRAAVSAPRGHKRGGM